MSSLFNALRQIEKQAEQGTIQLPHNSSPSSALKKTHRRPFLKILLITFLAVCTGFAILVFVWLKGDNLLQAKNWLALKIGQREPISQVALPPEKDNPQEKSFTLETVIPLVKTEVKKEPAIKPPVLNPNFEKKEPSAIETKTADLPSLPVSEKEQEDNQSQSGTEIKQSQIRNKKLLYQAEKRRTQGDISAAVKLYRKVWKVDKQPAIANNLAAGLLQLELHKEAASILRQALILSPGDPDLLYNLEIAESIK